MTEIDRRLPTVFEYDSLDLGETSDLVTGMGNHEAKCMLILYLAQNPGHFSQYGMQNGFREFIGPEASWTPTNPFAYCEKSLEPLGQVVQGKIDSRQGWTKSYSISEKGGNLGVPLAGLLLQWSLDNPTISLQQIFGSSQGSEQAKAPQNRIAFLAELVTNPDSDLAYRNVAFEQQDVGVDEEYARRMNVVARITKILEAHGILTSEHVEDENDRRFVIEAAEIPRIALVRSNITAAVYDFIKQRQHEGFNEFTYQECLDFVIPKLKAYSPETDEARIRKGLSRSLKGGKGRTMFPGIKRLGVYNDHSKTRLSIKQAYRQPLENLIDILISFSEGDEGTIHRGKELAGSISADTTLMAKIMDKAKIFSPHANKQEIHVTGDEIVILLSEAGSTLDKPTIQGQYKERYGRILSEDALRKVLRSLVDGKKVEATKQRVQKSSKRERTFYGLLDSSSTRPK